MGLNQYMWRVHINGEQFGDYEFINNNGANSFYINTEFYSSDYHTYLDAVGYSWDPNYNIGENLNNGFLISYKNSTQLDWVGYSLDGQINKTISGNTIIPLLLSSSDIIFENMLRADLLAL